MAVSAPPLRSGKRHSRVPRDREIALVRLALALIALHVLDDAFTHPERGTGARDHVVSGLIPAALLALLAIVYPRLHAWWQSALAASLGALALMSGIGISLRHVTTAGLSGDDATGLAAALAGVLLLVAAWLAARRAWRRGAGTATRPVRWMRRVVLGIAVILAAFFVVAPIGLAILATHKARSAVEAVNLGRPAQPVTLMTSDDLALRGWYVPSRNRAAVIAFPGRSGPVPHARMLVRHGYGVLLIDRRGEGESDGDYNAFGWGGERDVAAAVAFLATRPDVDDRRIGGIGLSVGGELLLQAAAHEPMLRAVVADGAGIRSIRDHLAVGGRGPVGWISPLLVQTGATAVLSNESPPPPLSELVAQIAPRAAFFVYAGRGHGGEDLNPGYFAAAGRPKQLWEIPEAGHTRGISARPAEYERRVVGFFDRYLLEP